MSVQLRFNLFGSPQIHYQGQPLTGFVSTKVRALLIYLAVTGRPHSRDHLAELLWADTPASTRPNLRKALSNLRQLIGNLLIEDAKESIALNGEQVWVDVVEFGRLSSQGAAPEAVSLYQADFLTGFNLSLSYEFEAWALSEQSRLKSQMVELLRSLATNHESRNTLSQAILTVRRLLDLEPWHEENHRWLMELLAKDGQRSAALAHFEVCKRVLKEELDVEPSAETVRLVEEIQKKSQKHHGATNHILNGNSEEDHTQVLRKQLNRSSKLPASMTPLLGRSDDQQRVAELLTESAYRLVTLIGPPGIGKTRLGLGVAEQIQTVFTDGVYFVPLAAITDMTLVPSLIADALALSINNQQLIENTLIEYLEGKNVLIVLDNFEQITTAASILTQLLADCPKLRLLVTSRERLHLRAEYCYHVAPLPLVHAVALFIERAQVVQPLLTLSVQNKPTIEALCRHLDCLPLAIELVAAQSELFSPKRLLEQLRKRGLDIVSDSALDLPPRHRSLRVAIDGTYELLDEHQQQLFRSLYVFVNGFDSQAVEAFGFDEKVLGSLVNKNMVSVVFGRYDEPRFLLLETLRQYAHEKLLSHCESEKWKHCHALYFVKMAENLSPYDPTNKARYWYDRLTQDIENIRAAFGWVIEQKNVELALRLLWPMRCYWGNWRDEDDTLRFWMRKTIALAEHHWPQFSGSVINGIDNSSQKQIDLLNRAWYTVANLTNNPQELEQAIQRSFALGRFLAPNDVTTSLYHIIARVENERGNFKRADEIFCKCLQIAQSMTVVPENVRKNQIAWTIRMQGSSYFYRDQLSLAQQCLVQSVSLFQDIGQIFEANSTYIELHLAALYLNDFEQAEKYYQLYNQGLGENADLFSDRLSRLKLLTAIRREQWQIAAGILVEDFRTHSLDALRILYPEGFMWRLAQVAAHIGQHEISAEIFRTLEASIYDSGTIELIYRTEYKCARDLVYRRLGQTVFEVAYHRPTTLSLQNLINFAATNLQSGIFHE